MQFLRSMQDWQPPKHDVIRERSSDEANRRIDRVTRGALVEIGDSPDAIRARIDELDREWHLDRALIALFSVVGSWTASTAMRSLRRTGKLGGGGVLFWVQMGFLLHHAVRGWCPPVPLLRRLGFRSAHEISAERCTLEKRLRLDDGF